MEQANHVAIEMAEMDACGLRPRELGGEFGLYDIHLCVLVQRGGGVVHIASGVDEAAARVVAGERAPAHGLPFAGEGEVQAEVKLVALLAGDVGYRRKPRAGGHARGGAHAALLQQGLPSADAGLAHADIVGVDDQDAIIGGEA